MLKGYGITRLLREILNQKQEVLPGDSCQSVIRGLKGTGMLDVLIWSSPMAFHAAAAASDQVIPFTRHLVLFLQRLPAKPPRFPEKKPVCLAEITIRTNGCKCRWPNLFSRRSREGSKREQRSFSLTTAFD